MPDAIPFNHPVGSAKMTADTATSLREIANVPFVLRGVELHTALFEVPYSQVVAQLPLSLHPSTPAYAALSFFRVEDSDVGAFEFATMAIACRSTIRPRFRVLSSFASRPEACELLREGWGFDAREAEIATRLRYDAAHSEVFLAGRRIVHARSASPEMLLGSARAIRYPQAINHVRYGGSYGLLQCDMAYEYRESYRGMLTLPVFDAPALSGDAVHPTDMIAGSYAKLDSVTLLPPRHFFDLDVVGALIPLTPSQEAA